MKETEKPNQNGQKRVAREFGVTQQRASQMERAALNKLRKKLNLDKHTLR